MMTKARLLLLLAVSAAIVAIFWPRSQFEPSLVSGKRVLVTGASSGIGEQLAYQYARAGASVFITARREALLEKVIERCKTLGSPDAQFGYFSADMENMAHTTTVIQTAVNHLYGLDQIILNHAYLADLRPLNNSQESFHILKKTLDVNMRSFAHLALEAVPHLQQTGGSIGVVNSILGKIGGPLMASYSASKFALDGFFTGLQGEIKRYNISVTMAVIGSIDTEMWTDHLADLQKTYKGAKNIQEMGWGLASAEDCAFEIMRGTTMREREIYFPEGQLIRYLVIFRELVVRVMDIGEQFSSLLN